MGYKSKKRQSKKAAAPTRGDAGGDGGGGAGASGSGMPAGPSSQASAATTRVSTQLQNLESEVKYLLKRATASEEAERCWREVVDRQEEVEKELRSQLAAAERARVEADILRRKRDKKAARLKAKIQLMFESNGSEAESAGSEGSGSGEEVGSQKPGRERPAGLSYKLREATTRATVRKVIGRKAEQLEAWLTHAVGDDDSWQSVYAEGGPGAQFGAPSGGDGGAEQQQQQRGDVDANGADGEEAGIVEEADLVGQPADVYTDLKLSQDAFQRLINLSSSKWDADMEKLVQMVLPYGNLMIKWPSVEDMLKGQGEELAAVGLSTTEDMISSILDLKLVLQHRARLLLKEGLIKPGESLRIQIVADATGIFNATRTNGTIVVLKIVYDDTSVVGVRGKEGFQVNSLQNNLPCAFFLRDDCYDDIKRKLP
eukprot:jgi/Tetstr1/449767/TSEL_036832.t1